MKQRYDLYTEEDHFTWKVLFDRQMPVLAELATSEFLKGVEKVGFLENRIPNFEEVNMMLERHTGWQIYVVPGIVEDSVFFDLMADKKFPATTWMRKMTSLDYLEEPDMFHDVFAHIPLLTNQAFVDFLQAISKFGQEWIEDEWAIHLLSRVYWYTVEFGLIREANRLKIYGAGILSSFEETGFSLSNVPEYIEFDLDKVLDTPYQKDSMQSKYFVIESFEQLYEAIPDIKKKIQLRLETIKV